VLQGLVMERRGDLLRSLLVQIPVISRVDEEIAEVLCEPWEGSGMAVRELGNSLSGRVGAAQL